MMAISMFKAVMRVKKDATEKMSQISPWFSPGNLSVLNDPIASKC